MPDKNEASPERLQNLRNKLSSHDAAGEAGPVQAETLAPPLSNAELVQLQTRVIALENLVIALMADASSRQLEVAREMSISIRPQPGHTAHPLTIHAAALMDHLVERGSRLRASHKP